MGAGLDLDFVSQFGALILCAGAPVSTAIVKHEPPTVGGSPDPETGITVPGFSTNSQKH
jgi:hypothetical protein